MVKPRALRPGDRVAVVAPASPFEQDELSTGLSELRRLGFEPVYDETLFVRRRYVAGEPAVRAAAIRAAWRDPSIGGLIAVRGGYGSLQLLPLLDPVEARAAAKAFIGSSDVTSILSFLTCQGGLVAFHGPMLVGGLGLGPAAYDNASLVGALSGNEPGWEIAPPELETIQTGEAGGLLFGGTLTQLLASLGTPYAFAPPAGYVLFLDEVNERPYRLDRMLTQLRQTGLLARAAAVVFGELPQCDEPDGGATARAVVADLMREFPGPVLFGLPSGHTTRPFITLPLGVRARVVTGSRPRLVIEERTVV